MTDHDLIVSFDDNIDTTGRPWPRRARLSLARLTDLELGLLAFGVTFAVVYGLLLAVFG